MKEPLSIAWLGPVFSEAEMLAGKAISPAGNRWQTGLLSALAETGVRLSVWGFRPEPAFPSGPLWASGLSETFAWTNNLLPYLNVPYLRHLHQGGLLRRHLQRRKLAPNTVLLSYNAPWAVRQVGLFLQSQGIPWVPIIADVPTSKLDGFHHQRAVSKARGVAFLSHALYAQSPEPKLHLDGGVSELPPKEEGAYQRAFLYTGLLSDYTGAFDLLSEFQKIALTDVELWVCGKGDVERARRMAQADSRIKVLGTVTEARLRELSEQALAFVNPRRPDDPYNATNFPSKILEYLSYGKPVISTWTLGLAPVYREVLKVCEDTSQLSGAMLQLLTWSAQERHAYRQRVRTFLEDSRTWKAQANNLIQWLHSTIVSDKVSSSNIVLRENAKHASGY